MANLFRRKAPSIGFSYTTSWDTIASVGRRRPSKAAISAQARGVQRPIAAPNLP